MRRWGQSDCILGLGLLLTILSLVNGSVLEPTNQQHDAGVLVGHDRDDVDQRNGTLPVNLTHSSILMNKSFTWVGSGDGNVPAGAVVGGRTKNGENLFIGRVYYKDDLLPGKIHPSHKRLYISYEGRERGFANYEVLVEIG